LYDESIRGQIVSQLQNDGDLRVLDVGCRTGYTTAGILKRNKAFEVVALDMNPVQLRKATENLAAAKHRGFISRGDADNLPFTDESFDEVISVGQSSIFLILKRR
jgi:ubiquinone/menaquinone biosynthesis C-methylase UbiE